MVPAIAACHPNEWLQRGRHPRKLASPGSLPSGKERLVSVVVAEKWYLDVPQPNFIHH